MAQKNSKFKIPTSPAGRQNSKFSSDTVSSKPHLFAKPSTMAELMARQKPTMVSLKKGDIIEGKISKLSSHEVLVDLGAKTEAVVLEKDKKLLKTILKTLKVGDKVTVSVLNAESDFGYPVVSLRRFMGNALWEKLAKFQSSQEPLLATVQDVTRGGFLVTTADGTAGFLPFSHTAKGPFDEGQAQQMVGKKLTVYMLELQRVSNKIIFSERPVVSAEGFQKITGTLTSGQKTMVVVTNITPFGVFVSLTTPQGAVDGLIHISEISWDKVTDIASLYQTGQEIEAFIIGVDKDTKRVDLSIKRLTRDPNEEKLAEYSQDQQVKVTVTKTTQTGVAVTLPNGVEGFIRKEKIPPTVTYEEGQEVQATVAQIDSRRKRIVLVPVLAVKPLGYR